MQTGWNGGLCRTGNNASRLYTDLTAGHTQYEGEAFYRGRNLKKLTDSERAQLYATELGFIAQGFHLIDELTVRENILVPAYLQQSDGEMRLATLLRKLKIENLADQKVRTLSGGQKQRVAIARALAGNPRLILADEPTGALDRETADEIMHILQEISRERPVLVITHDPKICAYADGIISIENGRCSVLQEQEAAPAAYRAEQDAPPDVPVSMGKRALHNFRVQCRRFAGISLAITVAVCAVLLSFSSQNILDEKIRGFEEKNTAFSWGQISLEEGKPSEQLLTMLDESPQIQQCYAQYPVPGCTVSWNGQDISVPSKQFGSISAESMNIGVMPRAGEIAITPSLAKQFAPDIRTLIGQEVTFTCGDFSKQLKICGIYSGSFDDYYLDAGTEQELYAALPKKDAPVSVAYQVQGFDDVLDVEAQLAEQGIVPVTAAKQVKTLQETFAQLQTLFVVVSLFIVAIALSICAMLLMKMARMRAGEMGLMMALGYHRRQIQQMLLWESLLLSALAAGSTSLVSLLLAALSGLLPVQMDPGQFAWSIVGTVLLVWLTISISNAKLLRTVHKKSGKKNCKIPETPGAK